MPVLMPQAFQRHSVYASMGGRALGGSTSGTNPSLLIPQGLKLPQTHTPRGGYLYQCRPSVPSRAPGLCQLGLEP